MDPLLTQAPRDHALQTGLYVLTGLLLVGALIAATLVKTQPPSLVTEPADELEPISEAA